MIFFKPFHLDPSHKLVSTVCGFFARQNATSAKISDLQVFHSWKLQFQDLSSRCVSPGVPGSKQLLQLGLRPDVALQSAAPANGSSEFPDKALTLNG